MYNNKNQADPEVEKKVKNAHTLKTAPHRESGRYVETVEKSLTQIRNTSPRQSSGAPHNYARKEIQDSPSTDRPLAGVMWAPRPSTVFPNMK